MVKSYENTELLDFVKAMKDFKEIPSKYWIIAVRSKADLNDVFDDKFYLFKGEVFVGVTTGTTNKGNKGTAVIEEGWHYNSWKFGKHRGKMDALVQCKGVPYRRDLTKDKKTNPTTKVMNDIIGVNFHAADYDLTKAIVKTNIGGWSEGCLVCNNIATYNKWMSSFFKNNGETTVCLINEF